MVLDPLLSPWLKVSFPFHVH
jgi:hypothetical protein